MPQCSNAPGIEQPHMQQTPARWPKADSRPATARAGACPAQEAVWGECLWLCALLISIHTGHSTLRRAWCCLPWVHTQEGGTTPDGSASGSSSSDEDAPPATAQPPQQQQGAAAAAAEAERQRKRQDALRRIEASKARLRKRSTGSAMVDAALQQMYARVRCTCAGSTQERKSSGLTLISTQE